MRDDLSAAYTSATGLTPGSGSVHAEANRDYLAARLPVADLAVGAVGVLAGAINRLLEAAGSPARDWVLRPDRVAAAFASDRLIRIDDAPIAGFAPLSGFFETRDGWIRTHANYPHHRARLAALVGLDVDASRADFVAAVADRSARELEDRAAHAGALVIRLRGEGEWRTQMWDHIASPQMPLVEVDPVAGDRMTGDRMTAVGVDDDARPLRGIRVLDLTRVLAGPVAGRDLALLGADVLRVDPPSPAEIGWQHIATGQGKRSALLDLRDDRDRQVFSRLIADADVLLTGYRPGALSRLGVDDALPGLVHGSVQAWEPLGQWGDRRGFDSLVQAATGISWIEGGERPGALPVQALDHGSGHLLAAGVIDALALRIRDGGGARVRVVLERTARWLLEAPGRVAEHAAPTTPGPDTLVNHQHVTTDRPALAEYDDYPFPSRPWGRDDARWLTT